jgi:hypothetical protein
MQSKTTPKNEVAQWDSNLSTPDYLTRDAPNVVYATTVQASRESTALFLKFATVFIAALAGLAAYFASKASTELALSAFLLTFGVLGFLAWRFTLIVASGNFAADREIRRKWGYENTRIHRAHEVYLRQLDNQAQRDRYLYDLRMTELQRDQTQEQLRLELALARQLQRMGSNEAASVELATPRGFVPAQVSAVRQAVMDWLYGDGIVQGVYGGDGRPNPDLVAEDGRLINHTIPWSSRGTLKGEGARKEALAILQPHGGAWLVHYTSSDKSWRLNLEDYPDVKRVQGLLGGY